MSASTILESYICNGFGEPTLFYSLLSGGYIFRTVQDRKVFYLSLTVSRKEKGTLTRNLILMFYPIMVPQFGQLESFLLEFKPVSSGLGFCCHSDKMFSILSLLEDNNELDP